MRPLLSLIAGLLRLSTRYFTGACFRRGLLAKTRALYDAPFTQGLISFDCAVEFDWKQHFVDAQHWLDPTKAVSQPPFQLPSISRPFHFACLSIARGAVVSPIPNSPDLTGVAHAVELERAPQAMVKGGLDTWGRPLQPMSFFLPVFLVDSYQQHDRPR
jgi:hypothetical protein